MNSGPQDPVPHAAAPVTTPPDAPETEASNKGSEG
jgi:hypothetical protein